MRLEQTELERLRVAAYAAWAAERVAYAARETARDEAREAADVAWEMDAAWVAAREVREAAEEARDAAYEAWVRDEEKLR